MSKQTSLKEVEREMEKQAAFSGCCNFGAAYLAAGGQMPDAVWDDVRQMNPLMRLLLSKRDAPDEA